MAPNYVVDSTPVSPFQMNAYVCGDPDTKDGVLIDAGADPDKLMAMIERSGLTIHAILQTHAHLDHAGAIKPLKDGLLDRPVYVHREEMPIYNTVAMSAQMYGFGDVPQPPPPDHFVDDGQVLTFGSLSARVLFLPGHTPGGVAYIIGEHIFVGDTLFMGSVGRTDLPLGDTPTLIASLKKLMQEDDALIVHSGHGPDTTIGAERRSNPFVRAALSGRTWM
ncbi:MAG: MBL fold metallo-hydrolase [Myxococcota bacterium]|nr:MBL fold metallo-hydrolase [Myxococcota bacterium]